MIQDRINNGTHNIYKYTRIVAAIEEETENDFAVEVNPDIDNEGNSFYHIELIADIARGFDVHTHATIVDDKIQVRLF